ncbi:hypothetical protein F4677DRAFT_407200 [Hypoxylon crocopeplum]|nr:hypothetical protein F4677DRAFT_407200 [Hypoxylon crocopeplum]
MTSLLFRRSPGAPRFSRHILVLRRCIGSKIAPRTDASHHPDQTQRPSTDAYTGYVLGGVVKPGERVLSVCKEYRISFPTGSLRQPSEVKLRKNPCKLTIMVSERHCFNASSLKYLDKTEHPFAKSVLKMYIDQTKIPLWYSAYSLPVALPFPCNVAARRVKHAFRDALAAYGYDREGRRVLTDSSSIIADLYGTVRIAISDPKAVCNIKFADLLEQAKTVVSGLELVLGRDKNGKHINPQRPKKNHFQKRPGNRPTMGGPRPRPSSNTI